MPLYEYQCKECGLQFERRQHFSDDPIEVCPECGGVVVRLIQPAGIIFKGSGFYVTDNRAKSPTATPGTRQESQTSSEEGSSSTETSKSTAGDNGTS
jgi:putative FmdB family regulatory protein